MPSITGTLLLLHAAYNCLHYRNLLQGLEGLEEAATGISSDALESPLTATTSIASSTAASVSPADVWIESLTSLRLILLLELIQPGSSLHPVVNSSKHQVVQMAVAQFELEHWCNNNIKREKERIYVYNSTELSIFCCKPKEKMIESLF
jgi:hypothetical protein